MGASMAVTDEPHLRRDAAENRQRLLAAAAAVFADQGLDGSVEEIARIAGYRRFPTKDALSAELVRELLAEVVEAAELALGELEGRRLELFLRRVCELEASHRGCQSKLWRTHGDEDQLKRPRQLVGRLLSEAQQHGRVRTDVTPEDITLVAILLSMMIERALLVPRAWERCLDLAIAGLRPSNEALAHPPLSRAELNKVQGER
ncbi:MAG: TetR family transcriptional regulator [Acidimicrobiaceae bacterium]|nr:TetR family transcriptional regulator [Acidimicrobiaceae bacterium]